MNLTVGESGGSGDVDGYTGGDGEAIIGTGVQVIDARETGIGPMTEITMPRLSDSMEEGTIVAWLRSDGETIAVGDDLLEIETDKATVAYESPAAGVLAIVAAAGETLRVGAAIATIGETAHVNAPARVGVLPQRGAVPRRAVASEPSASPAATDMDASDRARVRATPLVRRLAREHGIDLGIIDGTGPGGRITRTDVAAKVKSAELAAGSAIVGPPPRTVASPPGAAPAALPVRGESETQELTRSQQLTARRMSEAKATIPHFQVQTNAQMDALIALRSELETLGVHAEPLPSINDFLVKACALALRLHPRANGSYHDGRFELHSRVNVGIAVAAEGALLVPTILDADQLGLRKIAGLSRQVAERVRAGTVTPSELSGATFTMSNLGMYGMTAVTPVINPPQAAILGIGAVRAVPALVDGQLVERHQLTLTLSCDHRILYGAEAARFLSDVRDALQAPLRLLL